VTSQHWEKTMTSEKASNTPSNRGVASFNHQHLDALMEAAGLDVLIVTSKHNVQYMLGGYRFFMFEPDCPATARDNWKMSFCGDAGTRLREVRRRNGLRRDRALRRANRGPYQRRRSALVYPP
jgi:Creatinase/Prolidase N-terminal domain